jgi:MurNAc alpha-1-phosphate uridylyltransferase
MSQIKTAMVLAAGLGTRMRPLTLTKPKPLIEVAGRSLIDHKIDLLIELGIERIVVNTFYLPEMIEAQLLKRSDAEIIFSRETERLETGGGVRNALPLLGDAPFIVTSSDVIYENASGIAKLLAAYEGGAGAMLLHPVATSWGYDGTGDFDLVGKKITWKKTATASHVFTTTQILHPSVFENSTIKAQPKHFSLREIYNEFLPQLKGVENCCKWYHVGTPEAVTELNLFWHK